MNQETFESRVLQMWMTTRIPLTRANLLYFTKAPRKKLERWLDAMVAEGVLEVDADDDGEMLWQVRGAARSTTGPGSVEESEKVDTLREQVGSAGTALKLAARASGIDFSRRGAGAGGKDEKSVIASAALSFFLGPFGWLYAAPLREAIPAIVVYTLLLTLPIISWFMVPLVPLLHIVSGAAGAAYAFRYNQRGERTALGGEVKRALPPRRPI